MEVVIIKEVKTILDFLENTELEYKNNIAVGDNNSEINYENLVLNSKKIGTKIAEYNFKRKPIAIFMRKSYLLPIAMFGVLYSGNFYVILDPESPVKRINNIIKTLNPEIIIYDEDLKEKLNLEKEIEKLEVKDLLNNNINEEILKEIRKDIISTDLAYAIFTSGSTGVPKGTVLSNQNVISYINWFSKTFDINEKTVFGSQTELYFSMSVSDFFASIFKGARYQIIPKEYFSFPAKLIDYMNDKKVNTIYWVPSAYGIIAKFNLFKYAKLKYLEKALFAGEVMPIKYLKYWKSYYSDIMYANLFGPTETTDICSYYIVDREFKDTETLPIGKSCDNLRLYIIDDNKESNKGELYVSGSFLAKGYYNNLEKTNEVFIQNPLHNNYSEIVYKTGDLVRINKRGNLEYLGRKDFQIKHMGYRIELGEIEAVINSVPNIKQVICVYDNIKDEIILFYEGNEIDEEVLTSITREKLPNYMQPNRIIKVDLFECNANGKIDRKLLKEKYIKTKEGNK